MWGMVLTPPQTPEPSFTLEEFLELTGGIPAALKSEEVAAQRQAQLEALDPDDNPF